LSESIDRLDLVENYMSLSRSDGQHDGHSAMRQRFTDQKER
jgi:hypothetical protein